MTEVNSMYHAESRGDGLKAQIDKLEGLAHHTVVNPTFDQFDADTEDMLINILRRESSVCGILQVCHRGGSRSAGKYAGISSGTIDTRCPEERTAATAAGA